MSKEGTTFRIERRVLDTINEFPWFVTRDLTVGRILSGPSAGKMADVSALHGEKIDAGSI